MTALNRDATSALAERLLTFRRFAALGDITDHIQENVGERGIVAGFFRARAASDEGPIGAPDNFLYLNRLCFVVDGREVRSFPSPQQAVDEISRLSGLEELERYEFENLIFFCSHALGVDIAQSLADLLMAFYGACDVDGNQIEGAVRRLVRRTGEAPTNLPDIAAAITSRFGVMAPYYLAYQAEGRAEYGLIDRPFDQFAASLLALDDVRIAAQESLGKGLSFSGRVTCEGQNFYYKVVPVIYMDADLRRQFVFDAGSDRITKVRPSTTYRRQAAIVLFDTQPISRFCYGYAQGLVDDFAGAVSHATKTMVMQRVAELRANAQLDLLETPFTGAASQRNRIHEFAQAICSALVHVTPAHSATVRLVDPFQQTLEVAGSAFCNSLHMGSAITYPIPVDPENSLNAFVFQHIQDPRGVYIRDVREPLPEALVQKGLKTLMACRIETKSEMCVPIRKTGLTIGVVNVEAGTDHAFDRDAGFIEWMVRQLGEYIDVVTRSSDAGWLPRLSFMPFAAHQVQKLKRKLKDNPEILKEITDAERRISVDYIDPDERDLVRTSDLQDRVREFMGGELDQSVAGLEVSGDIPEWLPPQVAHSLEVILENLLQNAKHHDDMRYPVRMEFIEASDGEGVPGSSLAISYQPTPVEYVALDDADSIGIAPRWNEADGTYHLGTFLAGVHVRLLGGMMWVCQTKVQGGGVPFKYLLQIPLNRVAQSATTGEA